MSDQHSGDNLGSFLLGSLIGVAVGLLLAPRRGKETRRRVKKWLDDLEEKGEDILEGSQDILDDGKEILQENAVRVKRAINKGKKFLKEADEDLD